MLLVKTSLLFHVDTVMSVIFISYNKMQGTVVNCIKLHAGQLHNGFCSILF